MVDHDPGTGERTARDAVLGIEVSRVSVFPAVAARNRHVDGPIL